MMIPEGGDDIVLSGSGIIVCLGETTDTVWRAVTRGECGVGALTAMERGHAPELRGGQAVEIDAESGSGDSREIVYLRRAIRDSLVSAGLAADGNGGFLLPCPGSRCAIVVGTTLHGMRSAGEFLRSGKFEPLKRFLPAAVLRRAASGLGLSGPALTTCSACSSSLGSIALGFTLLATGQVDLVVAGGYDPVSEYVYAGFNSLRLVSPKPPRPFSRDRKGMNVGEGYGIVVMERARDAQHRGARQLARVAGYGESADAHHLTQPHPRGDGAARAVRAALASAALTPSEIGLVAAHGTATSDNDSGEYAALKQVWGESLANVPVVAFKSHLSHTLGAAGAVELILSAAALRQQVVPPCANLSPTEVEFPDLSVTCGQRRSASIGATLNLSLGFGGANACMVLTPPRQPPAVPSTSPVRREVFITGIGVVLPPAVGRDAFVSWLNRAAHESDAPLPGSIDPAQIEPLLNARRTRRMSSYVKLSLAAAILAVADAGISDSDRFGETCSAILGTTHGSMNYCHEYYRQVVENGMSAANPVTFAEGVPNAAAAHLSLAMGIKGGCQSIIGSRTAGLDALGLAAERIACGAWDRAIVGAAEEQMELADAAYRKCGIDRATEKDASRAMSSSGCGAVAFVLESRESAQARLAIPLGTVQGYASRAPAEGLEAQAVDEVLQSLGDPAAMLGSDCGWWTDRAEETGMRLSARRTGRAARVGSIRGQLAECFSAGPLAAIAAVLLRRRLPPIPGMLTDDESVSGFASIASDITGLISGVGLRCQPEEVGNGE